MIKEKLKIKEKPRFRQFKTDEEKLEQIPKIKPEVFSMLDNLSKKILENQPLEEKEINDLEMIFSYTQDLERSVISFLDYFRSNDVMTKLEFLIIADYFLTANQHGPDNNIIKEKLMSHLDLVEDFSKVVKEFGVKENIGEIMVAIYKKINYYYAALDKIHEK